MRTQYASLMIWARASSTPPTLRPQRMHISPARCPSGRRKGNQTRAHGKSNVGGEQIQCWRGGRAPPARSPGSCSGERANRLPRQTP
eukprot:2451817-Pleurochrysis_carterae.AAC.3